MLRYVLFNILHAVSGIYAGACLSIALIDLRYIGSRENILEMQKIFTGLIINMGHIMLPQLSIIFSLSLLFSFYSIKEKKSLLSHFPLIILIMIIIITLLVHIPINQLFITGAISENDVINKISKWNVGHWFRTVLSLILPWFIIKFYNKSIS